MSRVMVVLLALCSFPLAASAQAHFTGAADCAKPQTTYTVEVGDRPGHVLMLQKTSCKWTTPPEIAGSKATTGVDVSTVDAFGTLLRERGYHTATLADGDKFTVRYQGTIRPGKGGNATMRGSWVFARGTGHLRGIQGSGTYSGTGAPDGSGHIRVSGSYRLPAKK